MPIEMILVAPHLRVNGCDVAIQAAGFPMDRSAVAGHRQDQLPSGGALPRTPTSSAKVFRKMVTDMMPEDCTASFHAAGSSPGVSVLKPPPPRSRRRARHDRRMDVPAAYVGVAAGRFPSAGHFQKILDTDAPVLIGFGKDDDHPILRMKIRSGELFTKVIRSWGTDIGCK